MIIDGYSVLFILTFAVLIIIMFGIFVQRQIFRLRNNSARRERNVMVGASLSKSRRNELLKGIDAVRQFQLLRAPKFTEIGTIAEHANAPYINRMIGLDELREIDRQLEFINPELVRIAGESVYCYLSRMRDVALPSLSENVIGRIGILAEHCRFRPEPFTEHELAELRSLIKEVVKILNSEQERLSALQLKHTDSGGSGPISASLRGISKRLSAENKSQVRKRADPSSGTRSSSRVTNIHKSKETSIRRDYLEQEVPLLSVNEKKIQGIDPETRIALMEKPFI